MFEQSKYFRNFKIVSIANYYKKNICLVILEVETLFFKIFTNK